MPCLSIRRWTTIRSSPYTGAARWRSPARCPWRTGTTCRWRTPRVWPGSARPSPQDETLFDDYTWASRTVAVVTDGTAVLGLGNIGPARRDAGHGGQGGPVQEVRRRRRGADLPGHHRPGRADRDRGPARAVVRRHQPGGHQRAALLRDRGRAQGAARHPRVPRRPARHGDRRARGAAQRRRSHRPRASATSARSCHGAGAAGVAVTKILLAAGIGDIAVADSKGIVHSGRDRPHAGQARAGRAARTGPGWPARSTRRWPAPTC